MRNAPRALMSRTSPASQPSLDLSTLRRDLALSAVFTVVGLASIFASGAGIRAMIAGSVGSVGAGCVAVSLTLLDPRLSYAQRAQASLPIVAMLAGIGFSIKENAWALAGYPLLLLGVVGLVPNLVRWAKAAPTNTITEENRARVGSSGSPALSN
jgi:hypothetical protein